jgi:penicillin-binding protein 1A
VVAAEDDRFYEHPGVDYQGILRAVFKLAQTGEAVQGGSTITMQVARNFFLNRERTFSRKLREVLLAFKIEKTLSKDEILALYLNQNYMGNRAYGVSAAAQTYYGKRLDQLELPQLAMLAGLYKAPSSYNPVANPERARKRRNYVLRRMVENNFLDRETATRAQQAALTASIHTTHPQVDANYVAEMVRSKLFAQYGEEIYSSGFRVYTTLQDELQQAAITSLRQNLLAYDKRHGYRGAEKHYEIEGVALEKLDDILDNHPSYGGLRAAIVLSADRTAASIYLGHGESAILTLDSMRWARRYINEDERGRPVTRVDKVLAAGDVVRVEEDESGFQLSQLPKVEGALVSLSPRDGAILALVGGFDYFRSRFNRAVQAVRQPGSNFKPFVYSAALQKGLTPATIFNDAPIVHETEISGEAALWRPENYSGRFYGPTRMRVALAKSRNLVSIRLLRKIGVRHALKHIGRFEMTQRPMPEDLSLALGTGALTPLELVSGYAVFANQGFRVEPYFIRRIDDRNGNTIFRQVPQVACEKKACENLAEADSLKDGKQLGTPARRVLDAQNAYQMVNMMRDVMTIGTAHKARKLKRKDLAGKTGTTNDQKDAWFSGFNHDLVTTVWVGFDHLKPLGRKETGGHLALPIWMDYMQVALKDSPYRRWIKPAGMVTVKIDAETGKKAGPGTTKFAFETFRAGRVPAEDNSGFAAPSGMEVPEQIF